MSEIWDKPITDTTDWGGDSSTGGLPVSGRQVQAWLKSRIAKILTEAQITKIIEDWVQENGFADDEGFVTLSSDQEINGLKNFLQGLMVNGGLVKYDPELKVWQLNGNLLVTGGISMYSNLDGFTPSTIMGGILTDEVTITVKDGRLTVLAAESGLNYDELDAYLKKYEYTTISEVDARISELVNGAPEAYDTLKEIADVLEGNVNSIGDILATLAKKANTTYVDEAIADTKAWVEEQQYINEIDPSYIEAALGYQPYDGDTNIKEFTTKTYVKDNFVSRTLANEIEAIHNFLNGFTIAGIPFRKMDNGSLFIDANVVFGGGATLYGTDKTPAPSIFDGLPIDNQTLQWQETENGKILVAVGGGGGGGVADSVAWANVYGKPKWLQDAGNAKPTYNYSEIQGTPDLRVYALASAIPTNNSQLSNGAGYITSSALNGYATQSWVNTALAGYLPLSGGTLTDALTVKGSGSPLTVHRTQSLASVVKFVNTDGVLGWLGVDVDKTAIFMTASGVIKKLLHSGNYSEYALPLSGGTVNGNITATKFYGEEISTKLVSNNRRSYLTNTGFSIVGTTTANWASGLSIRDADGNAMTTLIGAYGESNFTPSYLYIGGSRTAPIVKLDVATKDVIFNGIAYTQKFRAIANSSTNPTLGAMGSADFGMVVASGTTSTYGLYGWITGSGDSHLQTGREDGNTTPYNLIFQELGGNVGFGTPTPESKVHINGNTQITGNLIFDSSHQTLMQRKLNSTGETAIFTQVNSEDHLLIGQGIAKAGKNIYIYGNEMIFAYGTAGSISSAAMHIYSNGDVAMARLYLYPQTQALNASSGVLRFYSDSTLLSGPSIQGVHAQMGYGAKHLVFYQHNTGGYTEYEAMRLTCDGNLVIGGTTANAKLHVYGNLLTEGGITMYSQRSLKNILSYEGLSLEQLSVIKPIKFTWKDGRDNRYHVGGVADDMATVVPEVVYSANDFLTMDYGNAGFYVAASLIKPVINHETRIEQLERRVKELENENKQLRQSA